MTVHETHHASNPGATGAGVASVPTVDAAAVLASHTRREWLHWQPDDDGTGLEQYRRIGCAVCGEDWNTGGCAAVLLARRVIALTGLLREVCDGVIDVAYWRSRHNAVRQRRAVAELEDKVRAAHPAAAGGGGAG